MTDRARPMDDAALTAALRDLAGAIDWPAAPPAGRDPASAVRIRLSEAAATPLRRRWSWRPVTRALVLAVLALLALAAVAGALGLGLPGIRIQLGGSGTAPPPSEAPSSPASHGP